MKSGYITEDLDLRIRMVDKRLKKFTAIRPDIIPPKLVGNGNYKTLVVCWGSTFNTVIRSGGNLGEKRYRSACIFPGCFPCRKIAGDYLKKAANLIIVENNSAAPFARLIKLATGISIEHKVLKYNGLPFSVEEVRKEMQKFI